MHGVCRVLGPFLVGDSHAPNSHKFPRVFFVVVGITSCEEHSLQLRQLVTRV